MPLLFSYGTLQQEEVQRSTFGRLLRGEKDALPAFAPSLVGHHANATFTGRADTSVDGTVFELNEDELAAADEYERHADYIRLDVRLASGKRAWVYVDRRSASDRPTR